MVKSFAESSEIKEKARLKQAGLSGNELFSGCETG
jgi:hypothetical protein